MKNIYSKMRLIHCTVLSTILLLVLSTNATAQVVKGFTQRTSTYAQPDYIKPNTNGQIYNLRGDFRMAGNTNLTLTNYSNNGSNSDDMSYVDIDLDGTTINSSSSFLDITNDACTEIVYAGLYWSGRASTGSQTFNATNSTVATGVENNATNETLYHNDPNNGYYNLEIIRQGSSNSYNPLYRFNFEGTVIEFNFTNSANNSAVQYRYGTSGTWISIAGTYSTASDNNARFVFSTPFVVSVNGRDYKINYLNRDSRTDRSESQYRNTSRGYAQVNLKKITTASVTKTLNKREVLLKKEGGTYQTITANTNDIQYPNGSYANMYAAYADVTAYVRANKGGNYFVADLATTAGDDTSGTGYYGGWGLVVIYANPNMKWRDITVFDGYAYVVGGTASHQLPISGFTAAQSGLINVDIGVMAGEGDRSIDGDYFQVLRSGGTSTNASHYVNLGNSGGTGGFFNSNIDTGSSKNPNLVNNTGIDIQRISLPNQTPSANYIIGNNQTSTTFRYGSTQDTYIIYNLVFAVDAYVPEVEGSNQVLTAQTTADINNLQPGDEVTYSLDVFNYGSDIIDNGKIDVNIPHAMKVVSATMQQNTQAASGATGSYSFSQPQWINPSTNASGILPATVDGGTISWTLGTIPTQTPVSNINNRVPMATLTYKLKVTDNCTILTSSVDECALKPEINGTITGVGRNSKENLSTEFIKGYAADCNNTPIYGGIDMQIKPSTAFLTNCSEQLPVQNGLLIFKKFCQATNNVIPRNEIAVGSNASLPNYPTGTVFYATVPTSAATPHTGDFAVNSDGSLKYYYAVTPGSNMACYLKLATQLDVITQTPTISNVDVCFGISYTLNPTVATQDPGTSFYYFNNNSTTPLTTAPQPTKPGVYTYQVALGKVQGGTPCYGPKATFTITIRNCKTPVNPMIYTPLNR